jgi:hypothetical protein
MFHHLQIDADVESVWVTGKFVQRYRNTFSCLGVVVWGLGFGVQGLGSGSGCGHGV